MRFVLTSLILFFICSCSDDTTTTRTVKDEPSQEKPTQTENQANIEPFEPIERKPLFERTLFDSDLKDSRHATIVPESLLPEYTVNRGALAFSESLKSSNRRVVFSAAISAVELNPKSDFENSELVMPALAEAIHLTGVRNIYVISHNQNLRNQVKAFCQDNGYVFDSAANAIAALRELSHSSARDLILIDSGLHPTNSEGLTVNETKSAEGAFAAFPRVKMIREGDRNLPESSLFARELFLQCKNDVRTSHIPVVILAPAQSQKNEIDIETAKSIYGDTIEGLIAKPLNPAQLKEVCMDLFHQSNQLAIDAKNEAEKTAIHACQAVAKLKGRPTLFDTSTLIGSLISTFQEPVSGQTARVPHLREAAIRAMQTIASHEAYQPLMGICQNTGNEDAVRAAALDCLGTIYKAHASQFDSLERTGLIKMLSQRLHEDSEVIWRSAAHSLGHMDLSADERKELAIEHRLNRTRKY